MPAQTLHSGKGLNNDCNDHVFNVSGPGARKNVIYIDTEYHNRLYLPYCSRSRCHFGLCCAHTRKFMHGEKTLQCGARLCMREIVKKKKENKL